MIWFSTRVNSCICNYDKLGNITRCDDMQHYDGCYGHLYLWCLISSKACWLLAQKVIRVFISGTQDVQVPMIVEVSTTKLWSIFSYITGNCITLQSRLFFIFRTKLQSKLSRIVANEKYLVPMQCTVNNGIS